MKLSKYIYLFTCLLVCITGISQQPFTAGNIVVYRIGDGSAPVSSTASLVFLDEYTPSGTLVQSIQMPATGNKKVTMNANVASGYLTLSADGRFLVVPGANASIGTDLFTTGADQSIGLIDCNGAVSNVTIAAHDPLAPYLLTSAATDNGNRFWFAGYYGLSYMPAGASSPVTVADLGGAISVSANITQGQLYANASGTNIGKVGTGLPTTPGQSFTTLPGDNDPSYIQFAFADIDPDVPGVDVLYATSGSVTSAGLKKYSLVNGSWVANGTIGSRSDRYGGLALQVSGTTVTVFATRLGSNTLATRGGEVVKVTDNSGYNGAFAGTPTVLASVAIPDTKTFRGIALVPQPVPFTAGNIVAYRVGDGSSVLGTTASKVFLDEYTPAGSLVQSIQMPASGDKKITFNNTVNSGLLTLSDDGKYLVVPGFNAAPGTDLSGYNADRSIGLVDFNAKVSSITSIPQNPAAPAVITSAASDNGTNLWFAGDNGLSYTTVGSTNSTTISDLQGTPSISVAINNGQLYAAQSAGRIGTVGTGLPVTSGQVFTGLPGNSDAINFQFAFADLDASVPGPDVLYVASGSVTVGGIKKYSLVNGNWISNGTIGVRNDRYSGLAIKITGTSVTVFATRIGNNTLAVRGGDLVSVTDNSGYNGAFTGTPVVLASVGTQDTKTFRGVARVPSGCPSVVALQVPDVSSTEANIVWTAPAGAGNYEYAVTTGSTPPASGTATGNTIVPVNGLTDNTTYNVFVRTVCSATSQSEWAGTRFTTGCKAPAIPAITINISNSGVLNASWKKVFGAASYEYFISGSATAPATGTVVNDTSISVTGLNAVTPYYLHVRSVCGPSTYSPWVSKPFSTGCFVPTPVVTIMTDNAGVKWNTVPNAVRYEYSLSYSPVRPVSGVSTLDTVHAINSVKAGTAYYFHIRSVCSSGALSAWATIPFTVQGLQVYPNPVQDALQVRLNGIPNGNSFISIMDAMGRIIKKIQLTNSQVSIDTKNWAPGIFFVRYDDGTNSYVVRILKR